MAKKENNKCVAYLRYSSKNQGKYSIDYQKRDVEKYCVNNGLELIGYYIDRAYTGKNDKRPEFKMLLDDAKEKPIWNTVLMYDLSRFSRSVPDSTGYKADLRDMGFKVISITESCTVDDPGGLQERMIDMMNEHESRKIGERVSSTFNSKASRARHCGGVPPLGYDVIEEKLVINESEAVIVKSIFEMYLAGFSYQKMADDLNSKGWLTKGGRPFTKNSFHDILRQKKYVGTFTWNRRQSKNRRGKGNNHAEKPLEEQVIVDGGCPQIIDDETFQMVQEKLAGRQNGTAESKSRRHYMLGGLKILKCKECGRHMVGHTSKSHGYEYITYRCPNKNAHKCTNKDISAETLEKYVSKILVNNYLSPKRISEVNDLLKGSLDSEERKIESNRLQSVNKQIANVTNAIAKRGMSYALEERLEALEQEKRILERSLNESKLQVRKLNDANIKKMRSKLYKKLVTSNDLEVRKFVKKAVKEVLVGEDDVTVVLAS